MSEVGQDNKRYLFHIVHCPKCDGRVEVKCGEYRTNKELILEFEGYIDWIEKEYNEQGNISIGHYLERVKEKLRKQLANPNSLRKKECDHDWQKCFNEEGEYFAQWCWKCGEVKYKTEKKEIEYTDCAGICGFCEIKDTCNNPKRLKQTKKKEQQKRDKESAEIYEKEFKGSEGEKTVRDAGIDQPHKMESKLITDSKPSESKYTLEDYKNAKVVPTRLKYEDYYRKSKKILKSPEPNMADEYGNPLIGRVSGSAEPNEDISIKNIIMSVIKEFNKGLLGEGMDYLMMGREDLRKLILKCTDIEFAKKINEMYKIE